MIEFHNIMNEYQDMTFVFSETDLVLGMSSAPSGTFRHSWVNECTLTYFAREDGVPTLAIPIQTDNTERSWRKIISRSRINRLVRVISKRTDEPDSVMQLVMSNIPFVMECFPTTKSIIAIMKEFESLRFATTTIMGKEYEVLFETLGLYYDKECWTYIRQNDQRFESCNFEVNVIMFKPIESDALQRRQWAPDKNIMKRHLDYLTDLDGDLQNHLEKAQSFISRYYGISIAISNVPEWKNVVEALQARKLTLSQAHSIHNAVFDESFRKYSGPERFILMLSMIIRTCVVTILMKNDIFMSVDDVFQLTSKYKTLSTGKHLKYSQMDMETRNILSTFGIFED